MTWIRDEDDNLVNLDFVEQIFVGVTEDEDSTVYTVEATSGQDENGIPLSHWTLARSLDEKEMRLLVDKIAAKLPMLRL